MFLLLYAIFNFLACYQRHAHGEAKGAVALPCSSQLPSLHKLEGPTVNFILPLAYGETCACLCWL